MIDERIRGDILPDMDISAYFHAIMECRCLVGFHRYDRVAADKNIVSENKVPLSSSIIVGKLASSSEVHSVARSRTNDICSWVFGFVLFSEV